MRRFLLAVAAYTLAVWAAFLTGIMVSEALDASALIRSDEGLLWALAYKWAFGLPFAGLAAVCGSLALGAARGAARWGARDRIQDGLAMALGGGLPSGLLLGISVDLVIYTAAMAASGAAGLAAGLVLARWLRAPRSLPLPHDALGLEEGPSEA